MTSPDHMKFCPECNGFQDVLTFHRSNKTADGLYPFCDVCLALRPHLMRAQCSVCQKERRLTKFPGMDRSSPCSYCSAHFGGAAVSILNGADLHPTGHCTVKELLSDLGYPSATKAELNAGARWLRAKGYEAKRINGRKGYVVSAKGGSMEFREWAQKYRCVDGLELPDDYRERLMAGAVIPRHVRLAMSALIAGLPPYAAPGEKP